MAANNALEVYLNDHLAGSTAGRDLARKLVNDTAGTPHTPVMESLLADIEEDRESLEDVIRRLEVERQALKQAASWAAEKVGQLRFAGAVTRSPELSLLLEMETLSMGIHAKAGLWQALAEALATDPRVAEIDFNSLVKRAQDQIDRLQAPREAAAARALSV
jgi:O-acetylhomoserine/O-acetylserine sulfhydrylase-like pyridoxal-dependent enzyme